MVSTEVRESFGRAETDVTVRRLVRSEDQLDIVVELVAAELDGDTVRPLGPESQMRLTFGSQHSAEAAFGDTQAVPVAGVDHVAAGPSVVVVPVVDPFPFTVDGILAAAEATAGLTGQASEDPPDGTVTALEVPTGLWLSPVSAARLAAPRLPVAAGPTVEVWTARVEPAGGEPGTVELAAIQATAEDLLTEQDNPLPDADDRAAIVDNTTQVAPLAARRLWLSSSGATAALHGEWAADLGVALYDHAMAAGRDVKVQVQALGYLLPFGHRAAIAETSERVIVDDTDGEQAAALRVQSFLTIVEPTVAGDRTGARDDGRGLPLVSLTATTSETTPVKLVPLTGVDGVSDVVATDGGADLVVDYHCTDRAGETVAFSLPATFIDDDHAYETGADGSPAGAIAAAVDRLSRREVDLGGQRVAYADPVGGGRPSRATHRFRLAWEGPADGTAAADLEAARSPAVFGALEDADVVHEQVGSPTGATGQLVRATLHERWLQAGNDLTGNFDLAFLDLAERVTSLIGGDSPVGGVAQYEMVAEVFNQTVGASLDIDSPTDTWTVDQLLGDASKIIGNILLEAVIETIEDSLPGTEITVDGNTVTVEYTFCPTLHDLDAVGFRTDPGKTTCCLHVTTVASLDDSIEASFETELRLENFFLDFPPEVHPAVVTADFASLVGTISSDGSSDIVPSIRSWDFSGLLSLLMALVDKLGMGNVDLKIVGDVVDLDSSLTVPDVPLGVAELKNFSVLLGLDLPLGEGDGSLAVGIGRRSSPIDIDVLMFGATFWLELALAFNGKDQPVPPTTSMGVSVYWEMLDFDIFVASASFTLRLAADWKLSGREVTFTGAVSLEGAIDVLGLVSVSASIVASLTYESATEVMVLKGTINYCVDTFLGKAAGGSVPIGRQEIEMGDGQGNARAARATAGSSFVDRYSPEDVWDEYCDAFA
ncbi:MAG TPA: hypothetical protein VKB57_26745 [Acidimicrobiales bacterium]|nr:hypothetical protein [Acidimicrobiales bacterium]